MQYLRWKPHYVQEWIKILWIKITHYVQEEPLCCYIASSNACIYASENLCHDEIKLPINSLTISIQAIIDAQFVFSIGKALLFCTEMRKLI